jgi:NADPH-dependent curcumin reductase CurA
VLTRARAAYNDKTQNVITNWGEVITNRLTVRGFIIFDYAPRFPAALATLAGAVARGELVAAGSETVCEVPFEDVPRVWRGLFTGANRGKLVTQLV